jgi:hypothetical protein
MRSALNPLALTRRSTCIKFAAVHADIGGRRKRWPSVRHGNYDFLIRFVRGNRKDATRVLFYARRRGDDRTVGRNELERLEVGPKGKVQWTDFVVRFEDQNGFRAPPR